MSTKSRYTKKRAQAFSDDVEKAREKADSDSYLFDVEYEKLKKEEEEIAEDYAREREQYLRITEQLREEMSDGTASQADMARFMSVLTDRGVQLQRQQKELQDQLNELNDARADVENRMNELRKNAFSGATSAYENVKEDRDYKGFKNERGTAKVVEMRPEEYLRRIAYEFTGNGMKSMLKGLSPREVEKYMRAMLRGTKYKAPSLDYKTSKTSGAEKALAALMNGYDRIPVMIIE